ncbi:MAG: class I SAM-dependent methyltransferase [Nevskia sp.]|nr:class I SAM-dependent methyltransferase [Nevskia sp.]
MQDAESRNPVCNDRYARLFMDDAGLEIFRPFRSEKKANAGNVARARIIDDYLHEQLKANPGLLVVTVGAGFDSRPYRQKGGSWVEVDEPQLIAYKNEKLPIADCPNQLQRIPNDFATESIVDKLRPFAGQQPVVCVVEGVLLYLDPAARQQLFQTLRELFPHHTLICDVMQPKFLNSYARPVQSRISGLGASLSAIDKPQAVFEESGYRLLRVTSIFRRAVELGLVDIPRLVLKFMQTLCDGYSIYLLEA